MVVLRGDVVVCRCSAVVGIGEGGGGGVGGLVHVTHARGEGFQRAEPAVAIVELGITFLCLDHVALDGGEAAQGHVDAHVVGDGIANPSPSISIHGDGML